MLKYTPPKALMKGEVFLQLNAQRLGCGTWI